MTTLHGSARILRKVRRCLRQRACQTVGVGLGLAACVALSGCNGFFVYPGSTTTTTGTGTGTSSTGDYAYVSNSSSGADYLNGYVVSGGTLTAATGSPYSLGYSPEAMVITPNDGYLYIASDSTLTSGQGYLYSYSIGSGGALSILNGGTALESESIASLDVSPDGQWLFALDTNGLTLEEYQIISGGALKFETTYGITGAAAGVVTPESVKVAPSGDFIVLALGTGGMITYTFDTSTGEATEASLTSPGSASEGVYTVAVDSNNNIYAAGTVGLQVFTATTAGVPTLVNGTTPYATGNGPRAMVVGSGNNYVYTGNQTDGTITEDAIGSGPALTAITGSPITAPATVSAMGRDNSGNYILAAGYNATSGTQLYTIGSTGVLTESGSAPTGTDVLIPTVVAMTH